ncbi:HNWD NOD-like receptor pc14 [Podospora pseudocomata]|uniref:Mitochondrial division protein 1 n=1 Tax=Podospora pseudocomata TaxID=2093779 RepID=A0ABR0GM68_9PEZI|nr:HNWD NOD-like receptor pc14 [Podospora pseudocomata]
MRLLERDDAGEIRPTKDLPSDKIPPYAILSHTWGPDEEEVSYKDLKDGRAVSKLGYNKIRFCADRAWRDGLKFFWVDTCCIDKSNSTELQEAINSMFRWYRDAAKCYVYLTDVSAYKRDADGDPSWKWAFQKCKWFTRGWTLQELIAPTSVEFFSREKARIGDRNSLERMIHDVTGIPLEALRGSPLSDFSVHDRMAWMKQRNTTREEDMAYSLFGIFDVHLPLIYGEGKEKALERLREKIGKDDGCLADLRVTDSRHDKKRIEAAKGGLLKDSYCWVLSNVQFQQWRDGDDQRLLWIKGDPGKGKTMLLCGIIDELKKSTPPGLVSFFFCQATDSRINNATAVLRGLIYLLVSQQPALISHVRRPYDHAGKKMFEDPNVWVVVCEIFTSILQDPGLRMTYLIIDALDECVTDLPQLLELITRTSCTSSPIKWIVSSRNWPDIEEQLETATQKARLSLELNAESISAAVNAFIQNRIDQLALKTKYDANMIGKIQDYLHSHANGTFLWVALVCQALADPKVKKRHILAKLQTFPRGLDSLYARMLEQIGHSEDAELCKQILAVAAAVRRPISLDELASLIEMPDDVSDDPESLEEIVKLCGSFLIIREQTVYFVHQSAKDFLLGTASDKASNKASQEAFKLVFPTGIEDVSYIIFWRSLNVMSQKLRRDIYCLNAPGFSIDNVRVPDPDPLATVRYSCIYWIDHLRDLVSSTSSKWVHLLQDDGDIHRFLTSKYLYWLEALSLLRALPEGIDAIRQLESLLGHTIRGRLIAIVRDAYRFALSYRMIIEKAPLQAYTSALVFAPTNSIIKKFFKKEEPGWISTISVVEAEWNACTQTLEGHGGWVQSVVFSPDGQRVASGSHDNTIKIWDTASGVCTQTLEGHGRWVQSVAFSPDGRRVASGSDDNTIKIWDTASGVCTQTLEGHGGRVQSVVFSPDGQRVASGSHDNTIKIWDTASGVCTQTLEGHGGWVRSVAFSPDGQRVASGSDDNTIKIWDTASGVCTQTLEGHGGRVESVAFSPDGQCVASGSSDNTIKIWDAASGVCTQTLEGHGDWVESVAFSPDGQRVASGSSDNTIKIWDTASGTCTQTLEGHGGWVHSVVFSPDGQRVASGSHDNTIKIWDAASGVCTQTLEGHGDWVESVAFSPDGQRVASGSSDNTIKIWDTASGTCTQTLEGHGGWVQSVVFSPDGQRVASGSHDNTIKIWDAASGVCTQTLEGHGDWVESVAFSPDGQRVASGSSDNTIKIWDTASGTCTQTLEGHGGWVHSVVFSPDGQRVASGSDDNTIKIWDTASGVCTQTLEGHGRWVQSVAFSPDGRRVASGSDDNTIKIWNAALGTCTRTLNVGSTATHLSFDYANAYINTNIGRTQIATATIENPNQLSSPVFYSYGLGQDYRWITCNNQNVLWLPPEYHASASAMQGRKIVLGCYSGRVITFLFSRDV